MRRVLALATSSVALIVMAVVPAASTDDGPARSLVALPDGVLLVDTPASTANAATNTATSAAAVPGSTNSQSAVAVRWIDRLNSFRATAGLAPVSEVLDWSHGARLHSNYLVVNDRAGHSESSGLPGYSAAGAAAGANGNVISSTQPLTEAGAIDAWMTAPFHAVGMLDPRLTASGFGLVSKPADPGIRAAATLDVIRGLDWSVPWPTNTVIWPGPDSIIPIGSYDGSEWPDPLSGCGAGWSAPTALPVIVMFPKPVASVSATVNGLGGASNVCVVHSGNYTTASASAQSLGRGVLDTRNAALVIGRRPLAQNARHTVEVVATATDGSTMTASSWFNVSNAPFGGTPVWAELQPGASGHWVVTDTGRVDAAGSAPFHGDIDHLTLAQPVVAMQSTPTGKGYWLAARDGGVFTFGDAAFHGSAGGEALRGSTVAMEVSKTGGGYWLVTSAGEVRAYGDARSYGDLAAYNLAAPVVDIARTPSGRGYWLVASDGGVFSFGDAAFHGSAGAIALAQPVVSIEPSRSGLGYWLVALDGGVFTYGDAGYHGSAGGVTLDSAVRAMTRSPQGNGYWLLTERGQILAFGDAVSALQN